MMLPESLIVPPSIIRKMFTETHWETTDNSVLFTFDDGPYPKSTEIILHRLASYGVHALFFVNGGGDRGAMKEIVLSGHTLGNHLFHHKRAFFLSREVIKDSIRRTNEVIEDISGSECRYFRPPYGIPFFGMGSMIKNFNMNTVMWSLLSWDFRYDVQTINAIIKSYISAGKILVFHNNPLTETKIASALDYTHAHITEQNLVIGEPVECLM